MKLEIFCLFFMVFIVSVSALKCWTCENAKSRKDCLESGYSKQCNFLEKVCQTEVRYSVGWDKTPVIRTGCKHPHACRNNNIQNPKRAWLPTQCNDKTFNSVCRCCCEGDHCSKRNLLCQIVVEEITPSVLPPKDKPRKLKIITPGEPACASLPIAPVNGVMMCNSKKLVGSSCAFLCKVGFKLMGAKNTTCVKMGKIAQWDEQTPTCKREPMCDELPKEPKNGRIKCHGRREVGTECSFVCDDGYTMQGTPFSRCEMDGSEAKWNSKAPLCPPTPLCPPLGELRHGNITCTKEDNTLGTKCQFQCLEAGYELLPSERFEANCVEKNGKAVWSRRKPCCNAQCPPIARKDIVIVIDSSKSISNSEWKIMKEFVTDVIRKFEVSQDTVKFAVYRFNSRVDTKSQVLFGDYENVDELIQLVKNLPKTGGGTHVGKALRHARDYVSKHENREDVDDMIWILTDGKSKDEFKKVAEDLRGDGVEIIALGISRTGEEEFMDQLNEMTGDEELVMKVDDVRESFTNTLLELVAGTICEVSCE